MTQIFPAFSKINISQFPKTLDQLLKDNQEAIKQLLKQRNAFTWENLIQSLDDLEDTLEKHWSPFSHLHAVNNTPEIRTAYQACLPMLSAYEAAITHNKALYDAIASIDTSKLNHTQKKIIEDTLRNFQLSGVALPPQKQKRFESIHTRLAKLSNQFETNVLDAVEAFSYPITDKNQLSGLPEHVILSARERAKKANQEGWILNLETPCYLAVITYADDRALRETYYEAFVTRASDQGPHAGQFDNTPLIQEILALRDEMARLLDFNSYAALSIATKMVNQTSEVFDFIETLIKPVLPQAQKEVTALETFAKAHCGITALKPWDISYVSEKQKEATYALNDETLRPYFPLPHVIKGLFNLLKTLYGMQLKDITNTVDVWHPDVTCYAIYDSHSQLRGYLYMDLFARSNKRGGAWMNSAQSRKKHSDGSIQPPIAFLTCNFAKSASFDVPTLSHDEVITLFHELGHCLHHVLTQVDYVSASGINGVEWDAVELPSQFFENFCWQADALKQLSQHVETKQPLPNALFEALIASKQFQSGLHLIKQIEYAWFDFLLHANYPKEATHWLNDALQTVRNTTSVLPIAPYHRFAQSFTHLFAGGYAAGYYSYLWAEVLSSDAFSRFEEEGIFNPNTGRDFLTQILEVGSSQKAADFFKAFRGRTPETSAFLRHHGIDSPSDA